MRKSVQAPAAQHSDPELVVVEDQVQAHPATMDTDLDNKLITKIVEEVMASRRLAVMAIKYSAKKCLVMLPAVDPNDPYLQVEKLKSVLGFNTDDEKASHTALRALTACQRPQ